MSEWTPEYVDALPDTSFAFVEPGGTRDVEGKTVPRRLRHLPYRDVVGLVDLTRLAAAVAGAKNLDLPAGAKKRISARLASVRDSSGKSDEQTIEHLQPEGTGALVEDIKKVAGDALQVAEVEPVTAGNRVQSISFDKKLYRGAKDAEAWSNDHGYKGEVVDEAGGWTIEQEPADNFSDTYETTLVEGVRATVGVRKSAALAVQVALVKFMGPRMEAIASNTVTFAPIAEVGLTTIFKVEAGGEEVYFAEQNGKAEPVSYKEVGKAEFVQVYKADDMKYTLGVVYPASAVGKDEADFHGDLMREAELEKAAWSYMKKDGGARVGLMHRPGTHGAGRVVESYIYRGPSYTIKGIDTSDQVINPGSWLMGVVWEDEAWAAIKSGEIKGYSLQGAARKADIVVAESV